jgi:hypothetical protein
VTQGILGEFDGLLRLYHEGRIQPEPVAFPAVALPPTAALVRDDFGFVYGLRLAGCRDDPVPYAASWCARRTGMGETTAWLALRKLMDVGVLVDKGELPRRGKGNGTRCYLPGVER